MKGYCWVEGSETSGQWELLKLALRCVGQGEVEIATPNDASLDGEFGIVLGQAAGQAQQRLAQEVAQRLRNRYPPSQTPRAAQSLPVLATVVMIIPALPWDSLRVPKDVYGHAGLALAAARRIIVLVCGADTTVPWTGDRPMLGRDGVAPGCANKVSVIDIAPLIERADDAVHGVLCSCEAVGLIARLFRGQSIEAALACSRARLVSTSSGSAAA